MTNENIFVKYLKLRKYIIIASLIVLTTTSILSLSTILGHGFKVLQNLSIFLILFTLFFEVFESPFFLRISNDKKGIVIETFFPNFKKNVVFRKQNIKILKVYSNHKLKITKQLSFFSLKKSIILSVVDENGQQKVLKSFNLRWLGSNGFDQMYDIVECHNFSNHNSKSDEV